MEAGGLVTKLYPTLETPWTVALQAPLSRILEWVAISFSRVPSQPRDQTCISCIQVDSLPLSHQGSPFIAAFIEMLVLLLWDVFLYHDFEVVRQGFVGSTLGPGNTSALPYLWMKCWHVQLNDHWGKSLLLIQAPSCLEADSYCSLSASAYTGNLSDFWPSKKKRAACVFVLGFVFLSCHHLLYLVCPFLDMNARVLASSSPHSYNILSLLRSWLHGSCFKRSGLVHLQNLTTRGLWAHLTLKFLNSGTSVVVQWLKLCVPNSRCLEFNPWSGN